MVKDKPSIIQGMNYIYCQYSSKTKIFLKEET